MNRSLFLFVSLLLCCTGCGDDATEQVAAYLKAVSTSGNVSSSGGTVRVEIESNVDYDVVMPDVEWVEQTAASDHVHLFSVAPNDTYDTRYANIRFISADRTISQTIAIVQAQTDLFSVDCGRIEVGPDETQISFEATSNVGCDVRISDTGADWITQIDDPTRAPQTYGLWFRIAENRTGGQRSAVITVSARDGSESYDIEVVQTRNILFGFSPERFEVADDGGVFEVEVSANIPYEVRIDDPEWIFTEEAGDDVYRFRVAANASSEARSNRLVFCNAEEGRSVEVVVEQRGFSYRIACSPTAFSVSRFGGTIEVTVEANVAYDVHVSDPEWIGEEGSEGDIRRFVVASNESSQTARTGTLTFRNDELDLSTVVTVEQAGAGVSYDFYLGEWVLTGTSSQSGDTVSAYIQVEEKEPGVSYTVSGWAGASMSKTYPFEACYDSDTGEITISTGQVLGYYNGYGDVILAGFVPVGSQWEPDSSRRECFRGTEASDGSVRFTACEAAVGLCWIVRPSEYSTQFYYFETYTVQDFRWDRRVPVEPYYQDGETIHYQTHTRGNGLNLIILGDGYTSLYDMGRDGVMYTDMVEAAEGYFAIEPYASLRDFFDIYFIMAESVEEGASVLSDGITRDTAFSSVLTGGGSTNISCDYEMVFSYINTYLNMEWQDIYKSAIVLLINIDQYAGTCASWLGSSGDSFNIGMVPVTRNSSFLNTLWHESGGHGWGRLADEYRYYEASLPADQVAQQKTWMAYGFYANISHESRQNVSWADYFTRPDYGMVGYYQGASLYNYGVWRPEYISCMVDNRPYFNTPSREAIYRRTVEQAGEWFLIDEFLAYDRINLQDGWDNMAQASALSVPASVQRPLGDPVYIRVETPQPLQSVGELRRSRLRRGGR